MAKQQIKNYVFKPGIGALDYVYPDAYNLLSRNKEFLLSESIEYINQEIIDATKCRRDIGYLIDGVGFDVALGTNYNALFLGIAEANSLDLSNTVTRTIARTKTQVAALSAVSSDATALSRSNAFFDEVIDIIENGRSSANTLTLTNPTGGSANRIAAKDRLVANKNFLAAEVNAWVAATYPGADHDPVKCTRDVKYAIDALCYDILYGGNSATYDQAKFFFYGFADGSPGIDPTHRLQTVAAYNRLQTIVSQVVLGQTVTRSNGGTYSETQSTAGSNATATEATELQTLVQITEDVVAATSQSAALAVLAGITKTSPSVTWASAGVQAAKSSIGTNKTTIVEAVTWSPTYTYNEEKCQRDLGYVLDAYLYDLRYGGNAETSRVIHYYWDQDVAQVDGNRIPEIDTHAFIGDLITEYVLTNSAYAADGDEPQVIDNTKTAETGSVAKINSLVSATVNVITNGLSGLPTLVPTGVGTVKIQGQWQTNELLLITNTTKNEIIYNFSNNSTGGNVSIKLKGDDTEFLKYLQTTDGVTTITLNYDTSSHSEDDDLQIFVETPEVKTRPYDFGTDAIERMRIAPPLSMLDADFEYGLQPTKWSAIGTLRGYPSVYELPGTDTPVQSVVTDASSGTSGVGQSLITVTTVGPHGFTAGQPITLKALENSVNGAARAEGSFIITTVPSTSTFTYYAKAKVGTVPGTVLSTNYTQLRKADFFTGSSIGHPTIELLSNGSSGSMFAQLRVPAGTDIIPYDGTAPSLGAPLVNANIPLGSQVTAVLSTSAGGGTYITPILTANSPAGTNTATVVDGTGVLLNLAVDRGDGEAIYVTGVVGNEITFNSNFTSTKVANVRTYNAVSGANDTSDGINATFDITVSAGSYVLSSIATAGESYAVGDRIVILGTALGGGTPTNDLVLKVDSVDTLGEILTASIYSGTPFDGILSLTGLTATFAGGVGTNALFDASYLNGAYTNVNIASPDSSAGFVVGDVIVVPGSVVNPVNGVDGTHDLYIVVTGVGLGGSIVSVNYAGNAPQWYATYTNPLYTTTSVAGTGALFQVNITGSSYTVSTNSGGIDYLPGEQFTITGDLLGGATPANDLTITVATVDGNGTITSVTRTGTARNGGDVSGLAGDFRTITPATFDVSLASGTYTVTLASPGSGYGPGSALKILGTVFGGATPANDLTITVSTVDQLSSGVITAITRSGTGPTAATGPFTGVSGTNQPGTGTSATFNVSKNFDVYDSINVNNVGTGYRPGDRIIIPGGSVGGSSPANDITITVGSISGVGTTGPINSFTYDYNSANYGTVFDLISTVTMSDETSAPITLGSQIDFQALATVEVTFQSAHGLVPGDTFITTITSDNGSNNHNLIAGSYIATEIPTKEKLRFQVRAPGAISPLTEIFGVVYPRPDSFFIHRPFDGGVQLGTGGPQHGAQAIRQSKKYIRYQSGKGIMYTTGALFAPSYDLRSVTADGVEVGSLITVVTDDNDHGVQIGGVVRLLGIETPGYNSGPQTGTPPEFDYTVVDVDDERTFKVLAQRRLGSTTATLGFGAQMSVVAWHGATVRSGIFDDQNGIFWEYDGTQISVVQRTGTFQISGTVAVSKDSNLVTGTNTRFRDQVKAGDRIIIRGMTHVVSHVNSQTSLTVTPDFRGVSSVTGSKAMLITDKKTKQADFNLDRLDGTGPSGYNLDPSKMQMIGIQYSWYGAGFIDFMLRGSNGNFVFAHRMRNSNINTEAFMRSGNLPVRYEVTNEGPPGKLAADMTNSQTTIELEDASFFPESGTVYIDNEIISFTGKSGNILTGCTRATSLINFQAGATRSYTAGEATTHDARTGVILISNTITPLISHWGSAFLTDGGFDEDRGYIFSYAATGVPVSTTKATSFLIRLAPSVSNAIVGDLGERELLNRAQLLLQSLEVTSDGVSGSTPITGGIVIEGVLNPSNYPTNPSAILWGGLSGAAQGGQPSFAQIAPGGSVDWGATTSTATATVSASIDTGYVYNPFNGSSENNSPIEFTTTEYNTRGPVPVGSVIYGGNGAAPGADNVYTDGGQGIYTVTSIGSGSGQVLVYFQSSTGRTQRANNWPSGTPLIRFVYNTYTGRTSRLLFTKASWDASGAKIGTPVAASETKFPAGTAVSNVRLLQLGSTEFYEVTFNQTSTSNINASDTITFQFGVAGYALPGETVFSFIANPGERATVDFSQLKELTNTPLGGRGTFPNGPDVLAINVYKVTGSATTANLILKWGEAQA